jgi:hypothetical protein
MKNFRFSHYGIFVVAFIINALVFAFLFSSASAADPYPPPEPDHVAVKTATWSDSTPTATAEQRPSPTPCVEPGVRCEIEVGDEPTNAGVVDVSTRSGLFSPSELVGLAVGLVVFCIGLILFLYRLERRK